MSVNYLYKRKKIYYFRLRISQDLRHIIPATYHYCYKYN